MWADKASVCALLPGTDWPTENEQINFSIHFFVYQSVINVTVGVTEEFHMNIVTSAGLNPPANPRIISACRGVEYLRCSFPMYCTSICCCRDFFAVRWAVFFIG